MDKECIDKSYRFTYLNESTRKYKEDATYKIFKDNHFVIVKPYEIIDGNLCVRSGFDNYSNGAKVSGWIVLNKDEIINILSEMISLEKERERKEKIKENISNKLKEM